MLLLALGADLGRAYYQSIQINGAARQGMITGTAGMSNDIAAAIRDEPNTAVANNQANWGPYWKGQSNGVCGTQQTSSSTLDATCGDPHGCPPGSLSDPATPSVFVNGVVACFAVRMCTQTEAALTAYNGICQTWSDWRNRPYDGSDYQLQTVVVFQFTPYTAPIAVLFSNNCLNGSNHCLYLTQTATGVILH